ncbi:MAG: hypothetical protein ACM3X1_08255 [Ignavibacteriales bacterium]
MRRLMYFNWLMSANGIGIGGILTFLFFRFLLVVFIILILASIFRHRSKTGCVQMGIDIPSHSDDLIHLLNERLIKGEITMEEYQRLKSEIMNK